MISLEIRWNLEAEKEFRSLKENIQKKARKEIEKLPEKGLKWENVSPVFDLGIGLEAFRIKITSDSEEINHRIIFDVEEQSYVIYKVGPRSGFYSSESLKEVKDRK